MERDSYGNYAAAFTYRSSIDSGISLGQAGWAAHTPKRFVSERWHSVCTGSHRFKAFRKAKICLEWSKMNRSRAIRSGYMRFRGVPGVGLYVNNEWLLVKIGQWIEYVCSVKSETINLDRWVKLRCTWISGVPEFEVCLNFIPQRGYTRLYSSGKPAIHEPCLRIWYINSISLRQSVYPWMMRDILYWICLRRVEKLKAILLCNQL